MKEIDVVEFAEECLGIELWEYQKVMLRNMVANESPMYHRYDGRLTILPYILLSGLFSK